jgi:hypothetical protein
LAKKRNADHSSLSCAIYERPTGPMAKVHLALAQLVEEASEHANCFYWQPAAGGSIIIMKGSHRRKEMAFGD